LSADGKWVAVASLALDQMFFYPTGPGDAKKLDIKPSLYGIFGWFPDNSSVLICGGAAGATPPVRIKGLTASDKPIAVGSDSHSLIVSTRETVPSRIERVDILTGARTLVNQVAPPDQTGLTRFSIDAVIADGKGYAYTTTMDRGTLFVVTGAK
jgi:hypothetical protein